MKLSLLRRWLHWIAGSLVVLAFFVSGTSYIEMPRTVLLSRALASILLGLCCAGIVKLALDGRSEFARLSERDKIFLKEWSAQTGTAIALLGVWLFGQWPGYFMYDTFACYHALAEFQFSEWWSSLYSLYMMVFQQIFGTPGFVAAVQVMAVSVLAGYIFSLATFYRVHPWISRGLLLLFLTTPLNGVLTVSLNRDIVFSWCHLLTALFIPWYRVHQNGNPKPRILLIAIYSLLVVCSAKLRLDAIVIIPLIPFLLAWVCHWGRRALVQFCTLTMAFGLGLFFIFPRWTNIDPLPKSYHLTAIINPMGFLIRNAYKTEDRVMDSQIIDRVIDYSILEESYDPLGIQPQHLGAVRNNFKSKEFFELRSLYLKMIFNNPGLYFENRRIMFNAMMGFAPGTFYFADDLENNLPHSLNSRRVLKLEKQPLSIWLHDQEQRISRWFLHNNQTWSRIFNGNAIPLLFALIALSLFRIAPATAAASLIILTRVCVVFVTAPGAQFKYVYGLYLFGFFFPVIVWMELKARRPPGFSARG